MGDVTISSKDAWRPGVIQAARAAKLKKRDGASVVSLISLFE